MNKQKIQTPEKLKDVIDSNKSGIEGTSGKVEIFVFLLEDAKFKANTRKTVF